MTSGWQPASPWRGYINQIMYGTDLRSRVDDSLVTRLADELIRQRYFTHPVEDYYQAAVAGLQSGESLTLHENQDQEAARDLLTRLVHTLDKRKPWPEPSFTSLEADEWSRLREAPTIGRIPLIERDAQEKLHRIFSELPGNPEERVLILRMKTGQEVGLRSTSFSKPGIEVLTHSDPQSTLAAFQELTGVEVEPA